jgi:EAL domain-containing protein (putative c-di-GMP-specific phosphodiesterase class I)
MASGPALLYADLCFPIHRRRTTVGRRSRSDASAPPSVDLTTLDGDRVVSRLHAEIHWRDGQLFLVDVKARNGLFVNGQRVPMGSERQLNDSDSLSFGGVVLTFRSESDWPAALVAEWQEANPTDFEAPNETTMVSTGTVRGMLHEAVERSQLLLHFQPKVTLATGRLEAVECLVRWKPGPGELVFPDQFVPVAEATGFIKSITSWVLEAALRQLAEWQKQGLEIAIAVNISTRDLEDERFPERVSSLLNATKISPRDLVLEVTETRVMSNPRRAIASLQSLKATRVKISIDDFGIGQSSLASLRALPADELKIDKSFSMSLDAKNLAIVRSAITVGHDLGMRVTAEGVETAETLNMLRKLGCDTGQGYFWSKPVPADALISSTLALQLLSCGGDFTSPGKHFGGPK